MWFSFSVVISHFKSHYVMFVMFIKLKQCNMLLATLRSWVRFWGNVWENVITWMHCTFMLWVWNMFNIESRNYTNYPLTGLLADFETGDASINRSSRQSHLLLEMAKYWVYDGVWLLISRWNWPWTTQLLRHLTSG